MAYSLYAVTKMTSGVRSPFSASSTPKPSSAGICTSRKIRSGDKARIDSTALVPLSHSPTISTSGSAARHRLSRSRARCTSSIISVRIIRFAFGFPERKTNADGHAPARKAAHVEGMSVTIQMFEALARVDQSDSVAVRLLVHSQTVVSDLHVQLAVKSPSVDFNVSSFRSRRYAVLDGILHERLQEHVRNRGVERFRLDVQPHTQAFAHQRLLYFEILLKKVDLLFQRDFLRSMTLEREAQ